MKWILGTRGSRLAIAQSMLVKDMLEKQYPDVTIELKIIKTTGDKRVDIALHQFHDQGVFVKEIEEELLHGEIDLAVHSMKDMPSVVHEQLCFTKTLLREDARDVLILRDVKTLNDLAKGACIATGSARRALQLLQLRPDLKICAIRGNIETRIQKMEETKLDGIILAAAGLHRLQLEHYITQYFHEEEMIPACGQGALAIEVRKDHHEVYERINALCSKERSQEVDLERALLTQIQAGCHTPFGVRAHVDKETVNIAAMYGREGSQKFVRMEDTFLLRDAEDKIKEMVHTLKQKIEEESL